MQFFSWLCLTLSIFYPLTAAIQWHTDYAKARDLSRQDHKPILMFFNGSDWAGSAMKMKHEVLNAPSFEKKAGSSFVFMEVDFPKHSMLNECLAHQNAHLKNRFKIEDFPTLLLLDEEERIITHFGYLPENAEQLAEDIIDLLKQDIELVAGLKTLSSASLPYLQKLYQLAQELGNAEAIEQIREEGLKKEDPYFFLEKYRFFVANGEMKSEQALVLRQKLVAWGPESVLVNGQSVPLTVALIDFQEISQRNPQSDLAAKPLLEYLSEFKSKEIQNIWQVERMVAEIYLNAGNCEEALRHAESAYGSAPDDSTRAELVHSLDYIRSAQSTLR